MTTTFYIDESGHSGDLAGAVGDLDFSDQPVFSLACVGITNEEALVRKLESLRVRYGVKPGELKAAALRHSPAAIAELADWIVSESVPFFLEVTDKKFFLGTSIVNWHIVPPHHRLGFDKAVGALRNECADLLAEFAPDSVYLEFTAACRQPSASAVRRSFGALLEWLERERLVNPPADSMLEIVAASRAIFEARQSASEHAYFEFLPIPDISKGLRHGWILPNVPAFCNIYARINRYRNGELAGIRLIHDEQSHLDEILLSTKEQLEALSNYSVGAYTPAADYEFVQSAALIFGRSQHSPGIQLADLLAGSTARYFREKQGKRGGADPELRRAMRVLLSASNAVTGVGMNLVVPTKRAAV